MDLSGMRMEYAAEPLRRESLDPDPFAQFSAWFEDARAAAIPETNAFVLATASADAIPSQRTVLLKYFDAGGFVFFTSYESRKAREIAENPHVCMLFPWIALARQVIIRGSAEKISARESLEYFSKRPKGSRLASWISQQSGVISSRAVLEAKLREIARRFAKGDVSLPPFWGGCRIVPRRFEFWQGGRDRVHDRFQYSPLEGGGWNIDRLAP